MWLLVDAGNTRIKWAVIGAVVGSVERDVAVLGRWSGSGAVDCEEVLQLADAWRDLPITRVMVSNVAGQSAHDALERAFLSAAPQNKYKNQIEWFASVPALGGIRNMYRNPAQLGCDRFASMIGAHALFPELALIIATCGTATTVDAVTADGAFSGGMILPGPGLMTASLARNTAQLPQVTKKITQHIASSFPFADNTDDAIISGCVAAQVGAIERAVAAHARSSHHMNHNEAVQCILSGGAAPQIAPYLTVPYKSIDNLVLIGLQVVVIGIERARD